MSAYVYVIDEHVLKGAALALVDGMGISEVYHFLLDDLSTVTPHIVIDKQEILYVIYLDLEFDFFHPVALPSPFLPQSYLLITQHLDSVIVVRVLLDVYIRDNYRESCCISQFYIGDLYVDIFRVLIFQIFIDRFDIRSDYRLDCIGLRVDESVVSSIISPVSIAHHRLSRLRHIRILQLIPDCSVEFLHIGVGICKDPEPVGIIP